MADKIDQNIKGDNNCQIVVQGDYVVGLNEKEVLAIVESRGYQTKDKIIEIIREVLNNIPNDKKIKPDIRVFVPLLQQLSYSMNENYIKEIYKKMLESTMNSDKASIVHPSFINILSQLSSDEIKILDALPLSTLNFEPLISMNMIIGKKGTEITKVKYFSDIGYGKCQYPSNICKYIENLERLKLIEIPYGKKLANENLYKRLIEHPALESIRSHNKLNNEIEIVYKYDKMYYTLTSFGMDFISCCKK